jgi:excisionase family DNA binding protein
MGRLLKVEEVAEILRYKKGTAYNQISDGSFPLKPIRIRGKTMRFDEDDLTRYLQELKEKKE